MSNVPLPEPELFYWKPSFVKGESIQIKGYTAEAMHAFAAAVSAAKDEEIGRLRAEVAGLREDALRYREWKRAFREGECALWNALCECQSDAEHDAAIDAALAARKGEA